MDTNYISTEAATFLINLTLPKIKAEVLRCGKPHRWWVAKMLKDFLQTHPKAAGILSKSNYNESSLLDKIMR